MVPVGLVALQDPPLGIVLLAGDALGTRSRTWTLCPAQSAILGGATPTLSQVETAAWRRS